MTKRKNEYHKVKKVQDKPDDQETPPEIFNQLDAEYDFTLDAYATHGNAKCANYFTEEEDGLAQDWGTETVFCSPPSANLKRYVKDAYEKSLKGATVVLLIPSRTDGIAFREYINKGYVRFICGRIRFFIDGEAQKAKAPYPSLICVFGPNVRPRKHVVNVNNLSRPIDLQPVLVNTVVNKLYIYRDTRHVFQERGSEFPISEEELIDHLLSEKEEPIGNYLAFTHDRMNEAVMYVED